MLSFCCYNLQNKKCHDRHVFRINSTAFGLFRHDWDFCNFFLLYYSLYLRLVKMMRWTRIWRICLSWSLKSPMKGLHKDNILAAWYLYLLKANTDYRAAFLFYQINEEFIRIILFMFPGILSNCLNAAASSGWIKSVALIMVININIYCFYDLHYKTYQVQSFHITGIRNKLLVSTTG